MKKKVFFILVFVLIEAITVACGPSQAELDAQATQVAANLSATQTAEAPTLTPTTTSTHTPTPIPPTATFTPTPVPPTSTPTSTPSPTATPTNTPEPTATPTPIPPTSTPTRRPGPQAGHWEGQPSVSFEVTANGHINNFKIVTPLGGGTCTLQLQEEIIIETDGTFVFAESVQMTESMQGFVDLAKTLGGATPVVTQSDAGQMIEAFNISGKFDTPTNLSGAYRIMICGNNITVPAQKGAWSAEWKGP